MKQEKKGFLRFQITIPFDNKLAIGIWNNITECGVKFWVVDLLRLTKDRATELLFFIYIEHLRVLVKWWLNFEPPSVSVPAANSSGKTKVEEIITVCIADREKHQPAERFHTPLSASSQLSMKTSESQETHKGWSFITTAQRKWGLITLQPCLSQRWWTPTAHGSHGPPHRTAIHYRPCHIVGRCVQYHTHHQCRKGAASGMFLIDTCYHKF